MEEEEQEMLATPLQQDTTDQSSDCQDKCHSHFHDTVAPPAQLHHHHHDYHHILHHHHSQNPLCPINWTCLLLLPLLCFMNVFKQ